MKASQTKIVMNNFPPTADRVCLKMSSSSYPVEMSCVHLDLDGEHSKLAPVLVLVFAFILLIVSIIVVVIVMRRKNILRCF